VGGLSATLCFFSPFPILSLLHPVGAPRSLIPPDERGCSAILLFSRGAPEPWLFPNTKQLSAFAVAVTSYVATNTVTTPTQTAPLFQRIFLPGLRNPYAPSQHHLHRRSIHPRVPVSQSSFSPL